ncbi:MAG TPA: cytochrome c [Acidobacteriaceae bacterium]|nr:cytochrome c [Acidobacteriaceae bacterium]
MRKGAGRGFGFVTMAVLFAAAMAGCGPSLGPSKPVGELTAQEAQGRVVYQQDCASCHYANKTGDLHGPSLFAMYRKKYLPSGAPANDARVTPVIQRGRNMMPGFGNQLDDQQLQDLLAYLHTL